MKWTKKKNLLFLSILVIFFVMLLVFVKLGATTEFDNAVYGLFTKSEWLTSVMKFITYFGESLTLIFLSVCLLVALKDKKMAFSIVANLCFIASLNATLKLVVRRPRPMGLMLIDETGFSFPSGHSATAFAFYGLLIYLIYKNCRDKKLKIVATLFFSVLILAIGSSRIYLGVHFASDVLGGFLFASIYLVLFIWVCHRYKFLE